tara:strand:- start:4722 stop:5561 length:840 start_codon:yes stop_codon:yes gene_type:complete
MAKKQTKKVEVEESYTEETVVLEAPKPEPKPIVKELLKKNTWKIEDKVYYLKHRNKPLSRMIKSAGVYYFDEVKGYEREIKYCQNQQTPFVDEMKGEQRLEHIVFRNGALHVTREKQTLQKLLSLYHPDKDLLYYEYKPEEVAENQVSRLELEVEALIAASSLDIDMAEAVLRVEMGSRVTEMSSKELKRDLLLYAKKNPQLFLDLLNDDNVVLRNFGIKATELGVIKLSPDQRTFSWGSNDRKLMTVPFDEHPYTALAHWFKTDEGMEIYSNIEKRLN